ncbi:MAG: polyphenol oxidase family protein [Candidatus Parcubacteria bacterium]|nr:polyphenol oxidase family protein [Candidatus Parcubacteria bacterium]
MDFLEDGIIQSAPLLDAGITHGVSTKKFGNMSSDRSTKNEARVNTQKFLEVLGLSLEQISLIKLPVANSSNVAQIRQPKEKGILKLIEHSKLIKDQHAFSQKSGIDAAICAAENTCLAILPADCAAIMIFDPKTKSYAIIHAGKEGVEAGIIFKGLTVFRNWAHFNPEKLLCYIGPNICPKCYRIGNKNFNLAAEIKYQLKQVLVLEKNITISKFCTCHDHEHFYSHYRAKDKETEGRQIAIIGRK